MHTQDNNPFQAPASRVADPFPAAGDFVPEGRKLTSAEAVDWLREGWQLFLQAPGPWILISVSFALILMVLGVIPLVGIVANLLIPVFAGGLMLGCKSLEEGDGLRFGHLFAGFSNQAGSLVMVGVIYLVGIVAIVLLAVVIGGLLGFGSAFAGGGSEVAGLVGVLVGLLSAVLIMPLAMAVWFAPALIIFHQQSPLDAMKSSFFACLKNFLPFLVYGLVFLVLAILATLPVGLGWLVLIPVTQASIYAGYKSLFTRG
ncbi:MAG: hypothetical protein KA603_09495 [Azonexus sp.]|jgi:uncharacterized membrane protein|nr:hypothetical protein [Betaproteobacteria bacterium]MBK8919586.1 hypothetical protein [Betaproteobacteria bacterium]MBP6036353.1 hypothetical protein [Azonexus sp.]MBP6906783.1 hypothetical protein [Azonexus sp.]